ncbi:MAG: hypothetical protein K2X93_26390 [Candidatus Obscuribacterales bacterium]|nr:hypothetical protein [Candidatus Obscuribacterales bacterium]
MSTKEALLAANIPADTISKLEKERMLDAELLASVTAGELKDACSIPLGDAVRVKRLYPSAAPVATPTQPTTPVVAVLTTPQPKSDEEVLNGLKKKDEADTEEARRRWATAGCVFVAANDNTLDVKATLEAMKFTKRHGAQVRFQNTEKASVRTMDLNQLLAEEVDLNPLSLRVLAPGSAMYDLTEDDRLQIAFAVVTGVINASADEDTTIDAVQRKTARWKQVATDFAQAKGADSDQFSKAKKRCRGKYAELATPSVGSAFEVSNRVAAGNTFGLASLGGSGTEELVTALCHSFSANGLTELLLYKFNLRKADIVADGPLRKVVMDIVTHFDKEDRLRELVEKAREQNSGNSSLFNFAYKHKIGF